MKEKKDRVEDALHATKAALEEGVLPGGGVALLNAANDLVHSLDKVDNRDERTGYDIVINAIEQPFFKILTNAGLSDTYITNIETNIKQTGDVWEGFNPRADKSVNMFNEGIIDPTKVTRLALENAASVAGTLLITEAVVSKGKEKENKPVGGVDPNMLLG